MARERAWVVAWLALQTALGCQPEPVQATENTDPEPALEIDEVLPRDHRERLPAPLPPFPLVRTKNVPGSDWFHSRIDWIASRGAIHADAAGYGLSNVYPLVMSMGGNLSRDQVLVLLRHESPIVRGNFATIVITYYPEASAQLRPLLDDLTEVVFLNGCMGYHFTVAEYVAQQLRWTNQIGLLHQPTLRPEQGPEALAHLRQNADNHAAIALFLSHEPDALRVDVVRQLAAAAAHDSDRWQYATALAFLADRRDEASLRLFRAALKARDEREFRAGLLGVRGLRDMASVPTLEALMDCSDDRCVPIAEALVALGSKRSIARIEAMAVKALFYKHTLHQLALRLRGMPAP